MEKKINRPGIDAVSQDHPMNRSSASGNPKTFAEANRKLIAKSAGIGTMMHPLDKYYQDTDRNLFPRGIVHAENLGNDLAHTPSGRFYLAVFLPRAWTRPRCGGDSLLSASGPTIKKEDESDPIAGTSLPARIPLNQVTNYQLVELV